MTGGGLAERVISWQRRHGRHDLPWQNTRDPYRVWLSEIMLQQTQVASVIAYYARFVARCPDVRSLAEASQQEVLALWSGLGYYSRARLLHRCAQQIVQQHHGEFPRSAAALAELPGIGRSTAAAIAAFCFGERVAILDGNVKRVLSRALGFADDLAQAAHERALWRQADALLPAAEVDVYTQGLMDLGATVCLPRIPRCGECPLAAQCVAFAQGTPQRYPVKTRKLKRGRRDNALLLLAHRSRVFLLQRPAAGVWGGLWSLPEFDDDDALARQTAGWAGRRFALTPVRHVLTHFDWMLRPLLLRLDDPAPAGARWPEGRWVELADLAAFGLPAPVRSLVGAVRPALHGSADDLLLTQEVADQLQP